MKMLHRKKTCIVLTTISAIALGFGLVLPAATFTPSLGDILWDLLLGLRSKTNSILGFVYGLLMSEGLGDKGLGIILGMFSILFPVAKLIILSWDLVAPNHYSRRMCRLSLHLSYWSMLDVFVVAVLVSMLKEFPGGTGIVPHVGIFCFAVSVILTMIATRLHHAEELQNEDPSDKERTVHQKEHVCTEIVSSSDQISGISRTCKAILLFILMMPLVGCRGCSWIEKLETKVDMVIGKIDDIIGVLEAAQKNITLESEEWRKLVEKLPEELRAKGADLLANEVQNFVDNSFATAGVELRCNIDFAEDKLKAMLQQLIDALKRKREELKEAKEKGVELELEGSVEDILSSLTAELTPFPARICQVAPRYVTLQKTSKQNVFKLRDNMQVVRITGYGLLVKKSDDDYDTKFRLIVQNDATGKLQEREIQNAQSAINKTTAYELQINLQPIRTQFREGDRKLILQFEDFAHEIPIKYEKMGKSQEPMFHTFKAPGTMEYPFKHASSGLRTSMPVYVGDVWTHNPSAYLQSITNHPYRKFGTVEQQIHKFLSMAPVTRLGRKCRHLYLSKGGDRQFASHKPVLTLEAYLQVNKSHQQSLFVKSSSWIVEWENGMPRSDFTSGWGSQSAELRLPAELIAKGYVIDRVLSERYYAKSFYNEHNGWQTHRYLSSDLVSKISFNTNFKGNDLDGRAKAKFYFNPITVKLRKK